MSGGSKTNIRSDQIQDFLSKAFWLCENAPGICRRSQICQWLVYCLLKSGDSRPDEMLKNEAVNRVLDFFELRKREVFERELINFIINFSHRAPMRLRKCSPRIENGTDWGRTYQKSLVESSGRLCSFVNYSPKYELDYVTKSSLLLLAWDMGHELENFAEQLDSLDDDTGRETAKMFRTRARDLTSLRNKTTNLKQCCYYSERTDYALRRTPDGRRLADAIARWIFFPEWNFKQDVQKQEQKKTDGEFEKAAAQLLTLQLVKEKDINLNDLFEVVATVASVQALVALGFEIVGCDIDDGKPTVNLRNGKIKCRIRKNFAPNEAVDKLIHYRTAYTKPSGLQPDIVYKFWTAGTTPVYRFGDAKNYRAKDINYQVALHAMMHYLIAYRKELGVADGDVIPLLTGLTKGEKAEAGAKYLKIVLFFPALENGKKTQPGKTDKWHPVLFAYGPTAETGSDVMNLQTFFQAAINELEMKSESPSCASE